MNYKKREYNQFLLKETMNEIRKAPRKNLGVYQLLPE